MVSGKTSASGTMSAEYDGEGHRVKRTVNNVTTIYAYDVMGGLAQEYGGGSTTSSRQYLLPDHLGSTRLMLSNGGTVQSRTDYYPFGQEIEADATYRTAGLGYQSKPAADADWQRVRFTGKERDAETGLDYFGARYFSGAQGRFTSPDPLLNSGRPDNPQSWNRYAYGFNNPLRFTDPTGLFNWDSSLGGDSTDDQLRKSISKKDANRIIKQRKNITNALNKMAKSGDSALSGVASAYGTAGDNNGVTIAAGRVTPGAAAQAENAVPLSYDSRGNTEVTVTVPENASGNGLFISLAHEGAHVQDAQSIGAFGRSGNVSMTRYDTEMHGYMLTMAAARYLGLPGASATVAGTTFQFCNPSWTKTDLQTQPQQNINRFLNASPMYNKRLNDYVYQSGRGGN